MQHGDAGRELETFDAARVRGWVRAMGEAFQPVASWIPA
jgi:hypothetical protein